MIPRTQLEHLLPGGQDQRWRGDLWSDGTHHTARYIDGVLDAIGDERVYLSPTARVRQLPVVGPLLRGAGERFTRALAGRHRDVESELISALLAITPESRIVRLGGWEGPLNYLISRQLSPGEGLLAAVDSAVGEAERSSTLLRVRAPSWRLPFADGVFDGATTSSLHLEVDPAGALAEMARVVRVGGRVVISTVVIRGGRRSRQLARATQASGGVRAFELDRLGAMLCDAGLALRDEVLEGRGVVVSAERVSGAAC